jgi:beta-mannosidase
MQGSIHRWRRLASGAGLLLVLAFWTRATVPEPLVSIDLAGEWHYMPYDGPRDLAAESLDHAGWPVMRLPSNWFLLGSSGYPAAATADLPPLAAANPGKLWPVDPRQGLDFAGSVWFRRTVEWNGSGRRTVVLDLDMVDYLAEVFVNGTPAGRHEGYFEAWSLDITPHVKPGANTIVLKVSAPALAFDMSQQYPIGWPKNQDQIKGVLAYHDTRPGGTSYRGQERSTGGVVRGLALRESTGIDLVNVSVTPLDVSEAWARLVVEALVRNWTAEPVSAVLRGQIRPKNFDGATRLPLELSLTAPPGETRARTELSIERPALWWPWDHGHPSLYRLDAALLDGDRTLDSRTTGFGVRSIQRDDGWVFRLNGRRIYPRGSNYISTQWLSQADRAWYERDVALMKGAHLNSVRVHAHLERPEFYEVADEQGLMVWQDFPLQWGYTDLPAFHAEALRQAEAMIRRFHNHPSILVWCMHNESVHASEWMERKDPRQNLELDQALAALARSLDPARVVQPNSGSGDAHPYHGWYYGKIGDFARLGPSDGPFVTEYGAQALPAVATLRTMFGPESLWPDWEAWRFANFQPAQTFDVARIEQGRNIAEFVQSSQRYQARLIRYATEVFRRAKWTRNTGIYHFMFTDCWPSITWSVVDYYRRPKLGYAALRDAMQPVLPSIEYDIDNPEAPLAVHVVNDRPEAFPGAVVRWRVVPRFGRKPPDQSRTIHVPADGVVRALELGSMPEIARGESVLEVWLEDRRGRLLGHSKLSEQDFE